MAEKVTLRLEQYDTNDDGDVLVTGPINIFTSVDNITQLQDLEAPNESVVYVKSVTNALAPQLKARGAYFIYKELTGGWQEILIGTHSHENKEFLDRLGAVDINEPVGTKKFFTLEITDTDNSEATLEYEVNWEDLPKAIPNVPLNSQDPLYLGLGTDGNPEWKNSFVASQTFQFKQQTITGGATNTVTFSNIYYDSTKDEALVLDGNFFVSDRNISYNANLKTLTITTPSPQFEANDKVSLLIIRNGAAAVLETLAKDYWSKEEALGVLSGGSVNLRDYAKKTDLMTYAKKYHTHSQFARFDHDHDYQYAMFYHTHGEYLTRAKALELLEERLNLNPEILTNLNTISQIIEDESNLAEVLAAINNLSQNFSSSSTVSDIQTEIQKINYTLQNLATFSVNTAPTGAINLTLQLESYLNNRKFRSDQVDVIMDTGVADFDDKFKTPEGAPKDLTEVLSEIVEKLDYDYGNFQSDEVFIKDRIPVLMGLETQGNYRNGDFIETTNNLQQVITNLVQKEIIPEYVQPEFSAELELTEPRLLEIGELAEVRIVPEYIKGNAGDATAYEIYEEEVERYDGLLATTTIPVEIGEEPKTISIRLEHGPGLPLFSNLDEYYERKETENEVPGKIQAGSLEVEIQLSGKRALFYGSSISEFSLDSNNIRTLDRQILESYTSFEVTHEVQPGDQFIVFALPTIVGPLTEILNATQGHDDIIDLFSVSESVSVTGSRGFFPASYRVYSLRLTIPTQSKIRFTFKK